MDWLADFFSRLTIGYKNKRRVIYVVNSRIVLAFVKILYKEGFISGYSLSHKNHYHILIMLKYVQGKPVFKKIEKISTFGRRVYVNSNVLVRFYLNRGIFFISTNKFGILPIRFLIKQIPVLRIGGELLSKIHL
jgi:small subunit ribosomal protein S8